jgi:protein-tyrosine phosphatase
LTRAVAEDYARTADSLAEIMLNTLAHLDRRYGGAESYLLRIGVSREHLDAVRARLREPADRACSVARRPSGPQ